jgi:hypothetical protein
MLRLGSVLTCTVARSRPSRRPLCAHVGRYVNVSFAVAIHAARVEG